jgi:hypothetical protein
MWKMQVSLKLGLIFIGKKRHTASEHPNITLNPGPEEHIPYSQLGNRWKNWWE